MSFIRTVRGDIFPADLGITYLHEHLIGGSLKPGSDPDLTLDSVEAAAEEMRRFHMAGGRAIVEMSTIDHGRNPTALKTVSENSGVHVICPTGYIKGSSLDPFVENRSINEICEWMVRDVQEGIDNTGIRAGLIKAGSSKDKITPNEEKVFRAAARAHRETGTLISTHTEAGTMGLEQVELLRSEGVPPERILIGHMDRKMDFEYHLAMVKTGVTIGYDQFSKEKYYPDNLRVEFVVRMVNEGYGKQLALSGDLARKSYFTTYGGGPGYTFILWRIVPWLREKGVSQADIDTMFIQTPARLLAFDA
jgi:5-phospho-D-xylono-1,4-lactonase